MSGQSNNARAERSVRAGFACHALWSMVLAIVIIVGGFVAATRGLHRREGAARAAALARQVVLRLEPGAGGDLSSSIAQLLAHEPRLVAVGTVNVAGTGLTSLYPNDAVYRDAAVQAVEAVDRPVMLEAVVGSAAEDLWGQSVALVEDEGASVRRVVLLTARDRLGAGWRRSIAMFGGLVLLVQVGVLWALAWWVHRQVSVPLQRLAASEKAGLRRRKTDKAIKLRWLELGKLAGYVARLQMKLCEAERQQDGLEVEYQQKMVTQAMKSKRQLQLAEDRATMDPLTGVKNRSFLEVRLETLLQTQKATKRDLSLVLLDIDHFKPLNDTCGHEAGDEILKFLGELLRGSIRASDHAVRYGGDEFVLVLPNTSGQEAGYIADRIVKMFSQYAAARAPGPRVTLSAGVASLAETGCDSAKELLNQADRALYAVKLRGKNAVVTIGSR